MLRSYRARFLLVHIGDPSSNQATTLESQVIHMIQELFGQTLTLQLPICFEVRALSGSLVSSTPEGPCGDRGGSDPLSSESDGEAADFLDRPTDQWRRGYSLIFAVLRRFVFFGGCELARWR